MPPASSSFVDNSPCPSSPVVPVESTCPTSQRPGRPPPKSSRYHSPPIVTSPAQSTPPVTPSPVAPLPASTSAAQSSPPTVLVSPGPASSPAPRQGDRIRQPSTRLGGYDVNLPDFAHSAEVTYPLDDHLSAFHLSSGVYLCCYSYICR
ncbi:unnamed protein product [Linum trigynum]